MHYKSAWQEHWNNAAFNKLEPVKPLLGSIDLTNIHSRRNESVLHRARIGHTYLTHSCLLKHDPASECIPCQCLLTVEHILVHCIDFADIRQKYYTAASMNELFNSVSSVNILSFLREIQLITKF